MGAKLNSLLACAVLMMTGWALTTDAELVSFEASNGFIEGEYIGGQGLPVGVIKNWLVTGANPSIKVCDSDGCTNDVKPDNVDGDQMARVQTDSGVTTITIELEPTKRRSLTSFYWAYRGTGVSACTDYFAVPYNTQTATLEVTYYDLDDNELGTDLFCGGLAQDWGPLMTLAECSFSDVPLSRVVMAMTPPSGGSMFYLESLLFDEVPLPTGSTTMISFEESEGFPVPGTAFTGQGVPASLISAWNVTGNNPSMKVCDSDGCTNDVKPDNVHGVQMGKVDTDDGATTLELIFATTKNHSLNSFYWAYRGSGNSACASDGLGATTATLDVTYYDLSGDAIWTDTFCGGLAQDWGPLLTLATTSVAGTPLSKVLMVMTPPSGGSTFYLESLELVEITEPISQEIQDALDALTTLIANITLTAGPQGPQGKAGSDGAAGAAGADGTAGAAGSDGAAGAQGPQGKQGQDGAAADCVACADVANGAVDLACLVMGENIPTNFGETQAAAQVIVDTLLISTNICEDPCDIGSAIDALINAKMNP